MFNVFSLMDLIVCLISVVCWFEMHTFDWSLLVDIAQKLKCQSPYLSLSLSLFHFVCVCLWVINTFLNHQTDQVSVRACIANVC